MDALLCIEHVCALLFKLLGRPLGVLVVLRTILPGIQDTGNEVVKRIKNASVAPAFGDMPLARHTLHRTAQFSVMR